MKNVVWENKSNGTRFRTQYEEGKEYKDSEHHKLIGTNLNDEDTVTLCKVTEEKNIDSFLNSLPEELRNNRIDNLITNLIRNGR